VRVRISFGVWVEHLYDGHVFYVRFILPAGEAKICMDAVNETSLCEGNVLNGAAGGDDLWVHVNSEIV